MRLQVLFKTCSKIIGSKPETKVKTEDGVVTYKKLAEELDNLSSWCYQGEINVKKIVTCKECRYYKRFKKKNVKNPYRHEAFCACSLDRLKRKEDFFCANGEEKTV